MPLNQATQSRVERRGKTLGSSGEMDTGAAYRKASPLLRKGEVVKAYKLLAKSIASYPKECASTYCLAGVALWIQGDYPNAVSHWKLALKCKMGVRFEAELLLYFASIRASNLYDRTSALSLLEKAVRKWGCVTHLDFVANYLVHRIDETKLRELASNRPATIPLRAHFLIDFYFAVERLSAADENQYRVEMKRLGDSNPFALEDILEVEWFLARYEGIDPKHAIGSADSK